MRYLLATLLAAVALLADARPAAAAPCGLPDAKPLWIDYGAPELAERFGRPGVIVAGSGADYPAKMRGLGAKTVYWDMYLSARVGTPMAPADPHGLPAKAQRVFDFAVLSAGCPDPVIAMNELFGASVPTPWTPTTARYRENVLEWARLLKAMGGHPVLLVSSEPFTGGDAGQWWRELAQVADIALEKYFNAPAVHRAGPALGSRRMRTSMRDSLSKLFAVGVPPSKLGVVLAFQTRRGTGGREGLQPAGAWFEVAKLQALAAKQVARELGIAHVWSWGWGFFNEQARDPDKLGAACAWLWARDQSLCDVGPLPRFDRDLRAGQIDLPAGVRCVLGERAITTREIAALARVTRDAEAALTILFTRLVQQGAATVEGGAVRAAEMAIVRRRFAGSRSGYLAALRGARASTTVVLGAIADELRREAIVTRLRASAPGAAAVAEFEATYAGIALHDIPGAGPLPAGVAPSLPLALLPEEVARPLILRSLRHAARAERYADWAEARQRAALDGIRCTRDRLPQTGAVALTSWMPFLAPVAGTA